MKTILSIALFGLLVTSARAEDTNRITLSVNSITNAVVVFNMPDCVRSVEIKWQLSTNPAPHNPPQRFPIAPPEAPPSAVQVETFVVSSNLVQITKWIGLDKQEKTHVAILETIEVDRYLEAYQWETVRKKIKVVR